MSRLLPAILAFSWVTLTAQGLDLRVDAPPALEAAARRVVAIDRPALAAALSSAGLDVPPRVHVTLV